MDFRRNLMWIRVMVLVSYWVLQEQRFLITQIPSSHAANTFQLWLSWRTMSWNKTKGIPKQLKIIEVLKQKGCKRQRFYIVVTKGAPLCWKGLLWVIQIASNWQKDGGKKFEGTESKCKMLNFIGDKSPKLDGRKLFSDNAAECLMSH